MKTYINPSENSWAEILKRPVLNISKLYNTVEDVLTEIKQTGDSALQKFTEKFDGVSLNHFHISHDEWQNSENKIEEPLKNSIKLAAANISKFHTAQKTKIKKIETMPGVSCWQKRVAIEKVGLYIPGGSAPLFSTVLMLAIPAKIAGCKEITLCTPPDKNGKINPVILFASKLAGVDNIFKLGGVQAIGAMAYGTETIPKVDKIFGPGNQYVTAAKQLVGMNTVSIDMPAGPSEVMVIADDTANPAFIASDLLSQAEHGPDSQVILIATTPNLVKIIKEQIEIQLNNLPRKEIAKKALNNSIIIVTEDRKKTINLINFYAPEHLILSVKNYQDIADKITNAGSVFLGYYTPESAGDYASGTNHTLPTNGWAKTVSGINLDSFTKKITFQEITSEGLQSIGPAIELMAQAEKLEAHKNAVTIRIQTL